MLKMESTENNKECQEGTITLTSSYKLLHGLPFSPVIISSESTA